MRKMLLSFTNQGHQERVRACQGHRAALCKAKKKHTQD